MCVGYQAVRLLSWHALFFSSPPLHFGNSSIARGTHLSERAKGDQTQQCWGVISRISDRIGFQEDTLLRGKSRWRSTVQSESDLNKRLCSEVKVFPQAFQDDGSKSQSSRQITVPAPRWLGLGGDGEGGRWPPFNTRLNRNALLDRNALLEWATAGGAGRGVEADEDPSQVAVLRGKSRWRSTVQSESDLNKRLCSEVKVFPQAFQDDGSKSQSSTSRQITVPAPRWLGLGGDGEGGRWPPFNTRLNRNALLEWATAGGAGRGVEADEDPSQVAESGKMVKSGEDGRGVREVVMGSGSGGGGCGVDVSSSHIIQLFSSPSSYRIRLLLIAVHLGRHVMVIMSWSSVVVASYAAHLLGLTRYDLKSVSNNMDADLESSAGVVVADLKSSDGSRPQDLLLAQSQQQQARHKAKARSKPDPHPTAV
ncbi:hypothetical protein BDZ89DRAFT_1124685 [Hymenopellis radicata]|nr:hypothetical protein BDZ89DRAFT_1124685 [Hymenopellis radicata]